MVKFCMFIGLKTVLQLGKCIVKAILKLVSFRTQWYTIPNITGQYRLGLQIDRLDRNRLHTTQETLKQNRELSTE